MKVVKNQEHGLRQVPETSLKKSIAQKLGGFDLSANKVAESLQRVEYGLALSSDHGKTHRCQHLAAAIDTRHKASPH